MNNLSLWEATNGYSSSLTKDLNRVNDPLPIFLSLNLEVAVLQPVDTGY
ncbi:hypothetical protein [Neobacillus massiliamazoniensis]|uniref:Uncharacterized protein n=1 Tax=Neobacillus massiliamazoniensis TaxID=1499688 RepID=A0A0U1NVV8_9BACI|nr:hypothetical protein [Neobacillus massiliamazoniensis]CRK82177.1 hypothetical protein BN000_02098 [Neobacillus massiliamazoniensis]